MRVHFAVGTIAVVCLSAMVGCERRAVAPITEVAEPRAVVSAAQRLENLRTLQLVREGIVLHNALLSSFDKEARKMARKPRAERGDVCEVFQTALRSTLGSAGGHAKFIEPAALSLNGVGKLPGNIGGGKLTAKGLSFTVPRMKQVECDTGLPSQPVSFSMTEEPIIPMSWEFTDLAMRLEGVFEYSTSVAQITDSLNVFESEAISSLYYGDEPLAMITAIQIAKESTLYWGSSGSSYLGAVAMIELENEGETCTVHHPQGFSGMIKHIAADDAFGVLAGGFGGAAGLVATSLLFKIAVATVTPQVLVGAAVTMAATASAASGIAYTRANTVCQ